jgi:hypothetical protein
MRNFNEADKKKKRARIQIQENPGDLSKEVLLQLEDKIKASLRDGHLTCVAAYKIAQDADVPKIAVGEVTDRLGIRIINCQIGCFKVDKNIHENLENTKIDDKIITSIETFSKNDELTCAIVFELASQFKIAPMTIADVANYRNVKIHNCQLGCF